MGKIDNRLIDLPSSGETVFVIRNGAYIPANFVDMTEQWQPSIDDMDDIVLAVDEDMQPYQLTGTNVEVNTNIEGGDLGG